MRTRSRPAIIDPPPARSGIEARSIHGVRQRCAAGLCALGVLLLAPAVAQAVAIDDFAAPLSIAPAGATTSIVATGSFTVQGGEPISADGVSCPARARTAWFSIVGNGQPITAAIDASTFDAVIAVYPSVGPASTPGLGVRAACVDGPGNTGSATFSTERGLRYLVQVGGKAGAGGSLRMKFSVTRPGSDDRASALAATLDVPVAADQSGATSESGEVLACDGRAYAGTVWFRYSASEAADVLFTASADLVGASKPGDTVMAVYRGSDTAAVACNDDADAAGGSSIALRVQPGDYLVQVGAKGGETPALGAGSVRLLVADRDHDRDGSLLPADCDDRDAARKPGAADVPANGIDEDCNGSDAVVPPSPPAANPGGGPAIVAVAPPAKLAASIKTSVAATRKGTTFKDLTVRAPVGADVVVSCTGGGCPRGTTTLKVGKSGRVKAVESLRGRRLRPGAVVRIRVTAAGATGREFRLKVRAGKAPSQTETALTT